MKRREVGRYWNENAEVWTMLSRQGYDVYRDHLNTPAFFDMLPEVTGLLGLDIGCGEGHNTRLLAQRGGKMRAIDISQKFILHAQESEVHDPLGIEYQIASAIELPFAGGTFDFATGFMSLMDIAETEQAISEVYRILKPGGFLQFSITHPCFDTPHRRNLRDKNGRTYALEVGNYFDNLEGEIVEWIFSAAPKEITRDLPIFKIPRFTRTLSQWINLLIKTGFHLEQMEEPCPSDETVEAYPNLQDAKVVAYFLHIRIRKPSGE